MGSKSRRLLNQSTHSSVANSTNFERPPRSSPMDHLGLVEAIDRLGESIVVGIADATNRRLDACLRQALGILYRDVLGGFKRSSQRVVCLHIVLAYQALRLAFSSQVSCVVSD